MPPAQQPSNATRPRTVVPSVSADSASATAALWTREVLVLKNISSPEQEQVLTSRIAAATRTCFDYTGPGIGLGDPLPGSGAPVLQKDSWAAAVVDELEQKPEDIKAGATSEEEGRRDAAARTMTSVEDLVAAQS